MPKSQYRLEKLLALGGMKKDMVLLALSGISLLFSLLNMRWGFLHFPLDIAWVAIICCGLPIILKAASGFITSFNINATVLVAIALIASVLIGEAFAAGEIAFIMQLGALLKEMTVAKARAGIEKLVHLTPQTARIIANGEEKIIQAEAVKVGDSIRILPGETVPVDGVVVSGQTTINQAIMTGESLPVDKAVGDEVFSGTANQFGAFVMKATKVGADSSVQRMIRLVQSAGADKAKIVRLADRWATWLVIIAGSASVLTWFFTGEIIRSVTVLVVFCPCALALATPTAIVAAIGNATRHGFLVHEGDALERLAKVSKCAFDKTGTLTYGTPMVTKIQSLSGYSEEELYTLAATAEKMSEHPLGKAIVQSYGKETAQPDEFHMVPGAGITAKISGKCVRLGKPKFLSEHGIDGSAIAAPRSDMAPGSTVVYIAVDERLAGYIVLSDIVREEARPMLQKIKALAVKPVLLTGDHQDAAGHMAEKLGISEVYADCRPEDKLAIIGSMQKNGELVVMVGDGINDAPALKKAQVGIAMGDIGSDIAIEAADIVLVDDEIKELPHLIALAKQMMTAIKVNLAFSLAFNFLAIGLAVIGLIGPVMGALAHNAGSVLVVGNSALLLKWRQ
ncbi:MAG: heavy metal translocating P-type ATPase [Lentisphaeria bacterium]|jgi:heavy metal translocating P-type ATPase